MMSSASSSVMPSSEPGAAEDASAEAEAAASGRSLGSPTKAEGDDRRSSLRRSSTVASGIDKYHADVIKLPDRSKTELKKMNEEFQEIKPSELKSSLRRSHFLSGLDLEVAMSKGVGKDHLLKTHRSIISESDESESDMSSVRASSNHQPPVTGAGSARDKLNGLRSNDERRRSTLTLRVSRASEERHSRKQKNTRTDLNLISPRTSNEQHKRFILD